MQYENLSYLICASQVARTMSMGTKFPRCACAMSPDTPIHAWDACTPDDSKYVFAMS